MDERIGHIRLYTGNGQGKTTAAFGTALRALGAGKRVFVGQFVKSMKYNETKAADIYPNLRVEQFGAGCFIERELKSEDIDAARKGWRRCEEAMSGGEFDLVVMDELTIAIYYGLLAVEQVLEGVNGRASATEIIITGRYASQELVDAADIVTEMREVKHYYTEGVLSKDGFDK